MKYIRTDGRNAGLLWFGLLVPVAVLAQDPGDLDITFGTAGTVLTPIRADNDEVGDMAIQADGKIVVAGHSTQSGTVDITVTRYLPDGALDPSFDGDGIVITPFAGAYSLSQAVAIQSDGKIVVGGYTANPMGDVDLALVRYLPDGSLDTTFSGDGKLTLTAGTSQIYDVLLQTDGKIVAVGTNVLVRVLADGTLDATFGTGGLVDLPYSQLAGALQTDGKIVLAGASFNFSTQHYEFLVERLLPDGTFDVTFNGSGSATIDVGDGFAKAVAVQPDGKIIAAGDSFDEDNGHQNFALVRYLPDGTLDPTFSGDGSVTADFGTTSQAFDLLLQPDGKMVVAGHASANFALARYLPDGSLDLTFSDDGLTTTAFGANDACLAYGLGLQPNTGRLIAAGSSTRTGEGGFDFAVAGYVSGLVPGIGPPTHKYECKYGGWREFTIPRAFVNEGDCIRFVRTGH